MSLQVWLPLNGDLHNQGLTDLTATNNGATVNNSGKIGKCYQLTSSSSQKITVAMSPTVTSSVGSLACWVKFNSLPSSSGWFCLMQLGASSGFAACRLGMYLEYASGINISINGSSTGANYKAYTFTTGTWYHICAVYDGTNVKLYINGTEQLNKTASVGSYTTAATTLFIGGTNSYYTNGYLNDVRYYDHALSPKEVEEIAKGLVLHYKLDDPYSEGTTNLWKVAAYSSTPQTMVSYVADNTYTYINHNLSSNINPYGANKVTISMDITNNMDTDIYFRARTKDTSNSWLSWVGAQSTAYAPPGKTTRVYQTFDWSSGTDGSSIYLRYYLGKQRGQCASTDNFIISHLQIETKDHPTPWVKEATTRTPTTIFDSSGYSNNGTIIGSLTATAGSPRYDIATLLSKARISTNKGFPSGENPDFTVAFWTKIFSNITYVSYGDLVGMADGHPSANSSFRLELCGSPASNNLMWFRGPSGQASGGFNMNASSQSGWFSKDVWHHIALVGNGITKQYICYLDGEQCGTYNGSSNSWIPTGNIYIGDTVEATASFSDFRVYATALTAAQVKELYNTSMSIDSSGNIYTRELVEI